MSEDSAPKNRDVHLPAETKVRLDSRFNGADAITPEFGVVVHCWFSEEIDQFDCYVAFFGKAFPDGQPSEKPYLLRYAATSLNVIT